MTVPVMPDFATARTQSFFTADQIYTGPSGVGTIVPIAGNVVLNTVTGAIYKVGSVDEVSHTSLLVPFKIDDGAGVGTGAVLGGGNQANLTQQRVFINPDRIPFSMAFDAQIVFKGTANAYIKVFVGGDVSNAGNCISAIYDNSGNLVSENIPLELITLPDQDNIATKAPINASCSAIVADNELLNVVCYANDGTPQGVYQFIAVHSNFIGSLDRSVKIVRAVEIVSEFLSISDNRLLEYPVGITISSDALMARILYADGTIINRPIDGDVVSVAGLNDLISTESGRMSPLLLQYALSEDEVSEDASLATPNRIKSVKYRARAVTNDSDIIYNVKLFIVPVWITGANPYWKLRYFLYTLERQDVFEVTNIVEVGTNSPVFNGRSYGVAQNLTMVVNLANVSNRYRFYRHVQPFIITLAVPGSSSTALNYWNISYANATMYGQGKKATVVDDPAHAGAYRVRVDNGYTVLAEWLSDFYYALNPLIATNTEVAAPVPTDVRIRIGETWQRVIAINNILNPIDNIQTIITQGQDVRLEFINQSNTTILELGMGSLSAVLL